MHKSNTLFHRGLGHIWVENNLWNNGLCVVNKSSLSLYIYIYTWTNKTCKIWCFITCSYVFLRCVILFYIFYSPHTASAADNEIQTWRDTENPLPRQTVPQPLPEHRVPLSWINATEMNGWVVHDTGGERKKSFLIGPKKGTNKENHIFQHFFKNKLGSKTQVVGFSPGSWRV